MEIPSLLYMLSGTLLGFVAGWLPGVGSVVIMLMSFPFLEGASLFHLLLFYVAMASASQFSGSVVATVLGIPGEASSLPAVKEGHKLFINGKGNFAISGAAIGSVLGSIVSVLVVYSIMPIALYMVKNFYNNMIQTVMLSVCVLLIIFLINRHWMVNAMLFGFGFLLSIIGFNENPRFIFGQNVLPYEKFPDLYEGLPFYPVLLALFVIPTILKSMQKYSSVDNNNEYRDNDSLTTHLKVFWQNKYSALRGSLFGGIVSLVPHIHNVLSSNLSYAIEKFRKTKKKTYNEKQGDVGCLIAAETANNATSIISMLPLLLIGIPITTSEAILLVIIDFSFYRVDYTTIVETGLFNKLVLWFLFSTVLCFIFSWPIISYVNVFRKISLKKVLTITITFAILLMLYLGYSNMQMWYCISVFLALLPIGILLKKHDTIPLVIGFILQDKLFEAYYTFISLNL